MTTHLTFIHALSALHAGTGQGVDLIDLPIARERATNIPFLPGSSLKGVLRDAVAKDCQEALFGPQKGNGEDFAGPLQISDQRLLLLPVRSMAGTFAWVTCPFVLRRLKRDAEDTGVACACAIPEIQEHAAALVAAEKLIVSQINKIVLEDLDLTPDADRAIAKGWAEWIAMHALPQDWSTMLTERICIVHDDIFNFLAETATEVSARIALENDSKTVTGGALWYEEALPAETVLYGIVITNFTPRALGEYKDGKLVPKFTEQALLNKLKETTTKPMQLGGKATTGKGICRVSLTEAGK